jgi:hypothetical protein
MRRFRSIEELSGPQSRRPYDTPDSRTVSRTVSRHFVRKGLRRRVSLMLSGLRGRISKRG